MQRRGLAFTRFVATLLALLAWSHEAQAYEEQASLDLSLGYLGLAASKTLPPSGPTLDVGGALGISDWLVVRAALGYAGLVDRRGMDSAGRARVEVAYLIDILQWVPFAGVGAAIWGYDGTSGLSVRAAGHLVFGLDYLASRTWTVGIDVRTGLLLEPRNVAWCTEGQLRLSRMFELF